MILFIFTFILIIVSIYGIKRFVYALLLFFPFFDMFDGFYKDDKIYAALRYLIPFVLIMIYMIKYGLFKKSDAILWGLITYLLLCFLTNAGDILLSARYLIAIVLTFLMIPLGKYFGEHFDFIGEFEVYNRILLISIPIYIVSANLLGFGESYSEVFSTGFYITSRMYLVPMVVFLAIHYTMSKRETNNFIKLIDILFILINICILLINTRRTTFGMLLGALLIYSILNRKVIVKMAFMVTFAIISLILSYPLYEDQLSAQLEQRSRIQDIDTYEEEGRYLETLYVIDFFEMRGKVSEVLFGIKLFDTRTFGIKYFGRDRPIHSDINMIFYSTGIVGSFLFSIFLLHYFILGNKKIRKTNQILFYPFLVMLFIVLIPGRFIGTMTYAPMLMFLLASLKNGRYLRNENMINKPKFKLIAT